MQPTKNTNEWHKPNPLMFTSPRHRRRLTSTNSLDIFVGILYGCDTAFSPGDICFLLVVFFHFSVCRVLEASSTPSLARSESSGGSPAVFTHRFFLNFYGGATESSACLKAAIQSRSWMLTHSLTSCRAQGVITQLGHNWYDYYTADQQHTEREREGERKAWATYNTRTEQESYTELYQQTQ